MLWRGRRQSNNVEDRRGQFVRGGTAIGSGGIIIALMDRFQDQSPTNPVIKNKKFSTSSVSFWQIQKIPGVKFSKKLGKSINHQA